MSQINSFKSLSDVETLTGDIGGAVTSDALGNIDLLGGTGIETTGTLNTITFDVSSSIAMSYLTDDANSAVPALNVLTVAGGTNIGTASAGSTVTINLDDTITLTTVNATYFDTDVAAAAVIISGTSMVADGTDANIDINITPKGTGVLATTELTLTTDLEVQYGGTGASTLTDHSLIVGSGTAAITPLAVGATGETVMGSTGADPGWTSSPSFGGTVTAGTGLTVTANDINISSGSLNLPTTTATGSSGVVNFNAIRFISNYGTNNTFVGQESGSVTAGIGSFNTGFGYQALKSITSGTRNACLGDGTGNNITTGHANTLFGTSTGPALDSAVYNTFLSKAVGFFVTTGSYNVMIGTSSASAADGSGYGAGNLASTTNSSNIYICSDGAAESNTIRIGTDGSSDKQQDTTYIAGIYGVSPGGTQNIALIDSNHQLGSTATLDVSLGGTGASTLTDHGVLVGSGTAAITATAAGATDEILIGNTAADPSWSSTPTVSTMYATIFDTNIVAAGLTMSGTSILADGTNADINITISSKGTGQVIINDLHLTTDLEVQYGGTGTSTLTDHGLLAGSGTAAVTVLAVGSTGETVMGSTGADPGWTSSPSFSGSITAGTGLTVTANDIDITSGSLNLPTTTATDGQITVNSTTYFHAYGTSNVFVGNSSGNYTLSGSGWNSALGGGTLTNLTSGDYNSALGNGALNACTSGSRNSCNGFNGLAQMTTGNYNTTVGSNCLVNLISGSNNVCIGTDDGAGTGWSGQAYTGAEGSNIIIQNSGVIGESNKIRIGTDGSGTGQQNATYIAGIYGVTPGGTKNVAYVDSNGQLGSVAVLGIINGGTGASTLTDHGLLLGSGTGAITALAEATNGQIPIGSTGNDPSLATLTAGSGISIVNAAGSITITSTDTGISWTEVTGTSQALAVNNGYILNNIALVTATLPVTAAVGDVIEIAGSGAGGWMIAQNAGQTIHFISSDTTTGVGGSLASTNRYDSLSLLCITTNSDFIVKSVVGNITLV